MRVQDLKAILNSVFTPNPRPQVNLYVTVAQATVRSPAQGSESAANVRQYRGAFHVGAGEQVSETGGAAFGSRNMQRRPALWIGGVGVCLDFDEKRDDIRGLDRGRKVHFPLHQSCVAHSMTHDDLLMQVTKHPFAVPTRHAGS